jgi:hypothetical protein
MKIHLWFEFLTAVKAWIMVFWIVTPGRLVGGYQYFGGTHRLHFQGSSDMLLTIYNTTRRHSTKDHSSQGSAVI